MGKQLGYKELDDRYKVTVEDITKHGGQGLLKDYFNGSPSEALKAMYPQHNRMMWRFGQVPKGFWEKSTNQREFFDWLGKQLGYKKLDDRYKVTQEDIKNYGGRGLLNEYYNSSLTKALIAVYPTQNWMLWRFGRVPKGFWETGANQREFFDWLGQQLGYKELDDWYNVTVEEIYELGGQGLLKDHYNGSPSEALKAVYPEHTRMKWRFRCIPHGFPMDSDKVQSHDNSEICQQLAHCQIFEDKLKLIFDTLAKHHNICRPEDWYKVTKDDISALLGTNQLDKYSDNTVFKVTDQHMKLTTQALQSVHPHLELVPWLFQDRLPSGFWEDSTNQREFFTWLGKRLGYQNLDDWYSVTQEDIYKHGGQVLLTNYYSSSPSEALKAVFPQHNWMMWKFGQTPKGFWENSANQRDFFDWLGKQLGYKELDDRYNVTAEDIYKHGKWIVEKCHSPATTLERVYPKHNWMPWKFSWKPHGFWDCWKYHHNHKKFFNWLGLQLGYKKLDDRYNVTLQDIYNHGGTQLLNVFYNGSPLKALQTVYPEHNWRLQP